MPIRNIFAERQAEIAAWRRHLHEMPEILFDMVRTAEFVASKLRSFGCDEVVTGIGRTGVVAVIRGRGTSSSRVIGLRADMDALPIQEETGLPWASKIPGAMHACGHDGHTAMLLGAAEYLAETRNFDGTVALIFQPAEEVGGGGREMCEDGMMERWAIQEVYAMHNAPGIPLGEFATRKGLFFASVDHFEAEIMGSGGHAARPQRAIDPVVIAAQTVSAIQTIVSRNVGPMENAVVSTTSIESSSKAFNVIPQSVTIRGTIRCHSAAVRSQIKSRIETIITGTAQLLGGSARVTLEEVYPVLVTSDEQTDFAEETGRRVSGMTSEAERLLGGEDFAFMLEQRPGAYVLLGAGDRITPHNPKYDFNDEIIPFGCSWWVELVESRLPIQNGNASV
ncbi:M20 aminoacylase family protein [Mesorhizobium sp. ANAO-SY3R2]|uniref:M20 aminoacylase family protein n=1 Tax=Mesorhizobium sp. ANAO-SY3R2 TaxID=3166644 RepID=UPI00366C9581